MNRSVLRPLFSAVGLLLAAGCSHYQLGTGAARPAFATLYVAPVETTVLLPQSRALLTTQIRETFARDARVTLADSPEAADATLRIVIHDYHREVAAVREGDTGLARKFALTLAADCTLRDNRAARLLFERRPITVRRDSFTDNGQLQSEYQALPLLAAALAEKIIHATLDVW